ncbi:MAG: histidine kinase [Lewinellaceae bacterium]|nr:histidine kinase [Lewinellaceae bacterium]
MSIDGNREKVWIATLGGVTAMDLREPGRYKSLSQQSELGTGYIYKVFSTATHGCASVSVFPQPIDFMANSVFPYDQNYFIFNFTGLWYTDPESVRYRYRLEGLDPDWKVSKDHLASYPSLPPGDYTFRVQTSEHGNFENVPEASWSFTIRPPFWSQWWFVLLSMAAVAGLIYLFIRIREGRLQRVAQLKRERVESQFAALKSQINPHFLFNSFNTLITIIEENPKVAVEYVEHLSDFYRSIIAYRERDFITLQEEMELVRSFDFLLKKRYEDGFRLVDRLNGHAGLIMPLALQMLVENAVKHNVISASRPLTIEIFAENDNYVVVRNNIQPKIKPEPSTHFGLQSLVHRYRLLGERPVMVEDNAAFFTVKFRSAANPPKASGPATGMPQQLTIKHFCYESFDH